jgi:protein-tyrosine phosphatase
MEKLLKALGFKGIKRPKISVLMVCMGNLCRSPMAEGVLRAKLERAGLAGQVAVDSAGTHGFHRGALADPRAVAQAGLRGYRLDGLRSRPVVAADFNRFDWLLAMDRSNLAALQSRRPPGSTGRLALLLPFAVRAASPVPAGPTSAAPDDEVPDPYFGNVAGFDLALDLIEPACDGLLLALQGRLTSGA